VLCILVKQVILLIEWIKITMPFLHKWYVWFQQLMDVQNDILVVMHTPGIHHGLEEAVILVLIKIYILPSQETSKIV
jgi:hypothetical protein